MSSPLWASGRLADVLSMAMVKIDVDRQRGRKCYCDEVIEERKALEIQCGLMHLFVLDTACETPSKVE